MVAEPFLLLYLPQLLKGVISEMTQEELQAKLLELEENFNQIKNEKEMLEKTVKEKEEREKELELHNQKLFLKLTNKVDKPQETNEEEQELINYVGKDIYNILSKKEIKQLETIVNGED